MSITEVGKAAVESFKGSPAFLALVIMAVLVFWLTYRAVENKEQHQQEIVLKLLQACPGYQKDDRP